MVCLVWPRSNVELHIWWTDSQWANSIVLFYMAESASGQDEANPAFWLATRAGKMGSSCPLARYFWRWSRKNKFSFWLYNKSLIDQACAVKMAVYWPNSLLRFYWPPLRLGQKKKRETNLANIQPWSAFRSVAFEVSRLTLALFSNACHFWMLFYLYVFTGFGQSNGCSVCGV